MENKCPKCGNKLGAFYFKPNCPHCGVNLAYYDMERRLEEDSIQAEKEFEGLARFKQNLKNSTVGNWISIVRLVLIVLATAILLLPQFKVEGESFSLLKSFDIIFSNVGGVLSGTMEGYLALYFLGALVLNFLRLVFVFFSRSCGGFARNLTVNSISIVFVAVVAILAMGKGASISFGAIIFVLIVAILTFISCRTDRRREK